MNTDVATSATALPEEDESMGSERPSSEGNDMAEFISSSKEADTTVLPTDTDEVPDTGYSVFGGTASVMWSQKTKRNSNGIEPDTRSPTSSPPFSVRELVQDRKRRAPLGAFHTGEDESDGELAEYANSFAG